MNRMLKAITSGILEGLLIASAILGRNVVLSVAATGFFIIQWKNLGKSTHETSV